MLIAQFGTCPQEARAMAKPGQPATDAGFGLEEKHLWGTLTTVGAAFDPDCQRAQESGNVSGGQVFVGRTTLPGRYLGYYQNVADAVRGRADVLVTPEIARDGLRVIELARRSHDEGRTVSWS